MKQELTISEATKKKLLKKHDEKTAALNDVELLKKQRKDRRTAIITVLASLAIVIATIVAIISISSWDSDTNTSEQSSQGIAPPMEDIQDAMN